MIARAVDPAFVVTDPGHPAQADHVFLAPDQVARVQVAAVARDGRILAARSAVVSNNAAAISDPLFPALSGSGALPRHLSAKINWYSATGAVIPTSDAAESRAAAASQAARRRQLLARAEHEHYRAAARLLARFAVFGFDRRAGVHLPSGLVISHPPVRARPFGVLDALVTPGAIDIAQIREIKTPTGATLWVVPSSTGLCLAVVSPQPSQRGRSATDCTASPAAAERDGAGLNSDDATGATVYGIVSDSTHDVPIRSGQHTQRIIHPHDGIYVAHTPFHFG